MSQYAFSLELPPVFSDDNFFISGCNSEAHQWIHAWPHWPAHALVIHGPDGSGKIHLGRIWAARSNANLFTTIPAPDNFSGNALIENIEKTASEKPLLHLLNA